MKEIRYCFDISGDDKKIYYFEPGDVEKKEAYVRYLYETYFKKINVALDTIQPALSALVEDYEYELDDSDEAHEYIEDEFYDEAYKECFEL